MTQYRKFETNIPRKGIAQPQSWFPHSCVCMSDLYIPTISLPILLQENMWTDPGIMYIAHRTLERGIWTKAVQFPFLGIHTWNFVAVWSLADYWYNVCNVLLAQFLFWEYLNGIWLQCGLPRTINTMYVTTSRTIPFLGIQKWDFVAVWSPTEWTIDTM
jgi:hypothetical protein